MSTATTDAVFFPHRDFIDFVIHYDSRAFHVHRLVLHYHSAYFRTYFQTLSSSTASASTTPSSDSAPACNHPSIAHSIHLPQQTTLVEKTPVTAADFRLFLCHLYFCSHYCYPPYLPQDDIDLNSAAPLSLSFPPVVAVYVARSLSFPAISSIDWSVESPQLRSSDGECKVLVHNEALLTLAYYFDCAAMLQGRQADGAPRSNTL